MAREPFNEIWANSPDPAQFEEPPVGTFASGWEGGPAASPPEAKWENWWHNRVDVALQQLERGGYMDYDAGAVYEEGAIARGSDGNPYRSQQGSNQGNDPVSDVGTFWVREPAGIATEAEAQVLSSLTKLLTPGRLGDALNAHVLGMGQTWQDMTGSRALYTTYTNTTGRTIQVAVQMSWISGASTSGLSVDEVRIDGFTWDGIGSAPAIATLYATVPSGSTYGILDGSEHSIVYWYELR